MFTNLIMVYDFLFYGKPVLILEKMYTITLSIDTHLLKNSNKFSFI